MNSFCEYIVNLRSIRQNILRYKEKDCKSKICAVVKANAYGVGIKNVVPQIDDIVDCFAVANFKEAVQVRQYTQKKIIILNFVPNDLILECINNNFEISVSSFVQVKAVVKNSKNLPIKIHLAVDTGMHRIGFENIEEFEKTAKFIKKSGKNVQICGIFSHIFNSKCENDVKKQNVVFKKYISILSKYFDVSKITKHFLASESAINYSEYRYDMVRLGILLYANFNKENLFCDCVEIKTKIIAIKNVKKGESVGYGKIFVAKRDMKIAVLPVGYADGIFRCFSKKGYVLCNDKFCKVVGNVCMDMLMADVSNLSVKVGDRVTVTGKDKNNQISSCQFAEWQNTICYEVLTSIKRDRMKILIKK